MIPAPGRSPAIGFIFVTLVLAVVGFGLLIPVLPRLVVEMQGGDFTEGAHAYGWIVSIYAFMQFVGSPFLGSLSDRFGRRRIILIATAGSAIDYVIMALAPNLAWLFLARTIAGFTAGIHATANAYIADVTTPEKRAGAFGLLGGAFGIGFVIGPVLGGFLGEIDLRLPFWVAAAVSGVNWLFGYFVLPESLPVENRRAFSWRRANPIGALLALKRFPAVLSLAESFFILMFAQTMLFSTWALYTDHRYGWTPFWIGLSLMTSGILSAVVQAVLVRKLVPRLGEPRAVILGMSIFALNMLGYGLATQGWMIFALLVAGSLSGITGPALQSYITKHVPADEQGAAQGVFGGLTSLAGIVAPFVATWSFGWAIDPESPVHLPGIAFFEGVVLIVIALLLAARTFRRHATG
ncbi:MAG: TCR/Tet family MFS transporter [Candidatus Didemnitutus sp.]|nr:TCR/Tet family MFS transporter [Candidatus Didemnitutus sp.]